MDGKLSEPSTANPTQQNGVSLSLTSELQLQLSKIPFFEAVKKQNGMMNFTRVALALNKIRFSQGEELFNIDRGNRQFIYVLEGMITIYGEPVSQKNLDCFQTCSGSKLIALLYKDGYCGNSQSLNNCKITRIVAAQKSLVYIIPLATMFVSFKGLLNFPELAQHVKFLQKVSLFEEIETHTLEKLIISSQFISTTKGTKIYEQGQPANFIYIVFSGTYQIKRSASQNDLPPHSLQISCVSVYQVLGAEDVMLQSVNYSETVHCLSLKGLLLKISQQKLMSIIHNKGRMIRLCKSRENWKKDRVQLLEKTFVTQFPMESVAKRKRIMSSTVFSKKLRSNTEPADNFQSIEMERCLSRRSHISSKKTQFFRNQQEYLNYKFGQMQRINSMNQKHRSVFELKTKSTQKVNRQQTTQNMSELMLKKFLNKKHKIENKMIFDYLKTRPPELVFNPHKEFALFKPLHITESSAVRNRKKVSQLIKSKYFKSIIPSTLGSAL